MGFLDSKAKKAAKLFLKIYGDGVDSDQYYVRKEWDHMSIAEREKILKMKLFTLGVDHLKSHNIDHRFTFESPVGIYHNFGTMVVKNPEKEAKKEFSELPEILRADIIQLFRFDFWPIRRQKERKARLQRMDDSNQGRGLNSSGNAKFTDTWKIGTYSITCTVEYWASEDTANAYWSVVTDKKFGGPSIPCYAIRIKIDPMPEYYLLKEIHSWIRNVRPFRGTFGPGNIFQHWKTSQTGQEEEIIKEIRPCLLYGFAGVRYEKDRTDAQLTAIAEKAEENLPRLKKQKHDEWVRSGGPEIEAEKARQKQEEQKMNEDWQDRFKRFKVQGWD